MNTTDSILLSTKKLLGYTEEYEQFDADIILHINTVLAILHRIGLGPAEGLFITDKTTTWDELLNGYPVETEVVKTFVYLRVRLVFDPPATSFVIDALEKQAKELEWTIYSAVNY